MMKLTLLVQADRAAVYYRAARSSHKRSQERYQLARNLRNLALLFGNRKAGFHYSREIEKAVRAA